MQSLNPVYSLLLLVFTFFHFPLVFSQTDSSILSEPSSPFSTALKNLQSTLNYSFQNVALLRRAMTHASFSEENNRALSILGSSVIDSSVALNLVNKNLDISSKDLNRRISDVSKLDGQCTAEGLHLGLDKIIRVSSKTNSSSPVVVCGAFRAIFGAVAVDSGSLDKVGVVYLQNRGVGNGMAAVM